MASNQSPTDGPQIRMFVACPRSGSTLLMRVFAESSVCAVTSRLILMGNSGSESFSPDYSILKQPSNHNVFRSARESGKKFLVSKEELGNDSLKGEYMYDVCPTPASYTLVRPVFLIRDPIRVFDSWKNVGWTDTNSLIDCYTNLFRMLRKAPAHAVSCLLYEQLVKDPRTEILRICVRWGIPFSDSMLSSSQPFGSSFVFSMARERIIYCDNKPSGSFTTVEANNAVENEVPYHGLLSNFEKDHIEQHLGRLYIDCWKEDIFRLRAILAEKSWIGFDLDDTIHEFKHSSGKATSRVIQKISDQHDIPVAALQNEYQNILKEKTSNAFSDGKTSFDYRRERWTALLASFDILEDVGFVNELLDLYESTLTEALELKAGALDLLSTLKGMGKKIVVITEGPQDAQERTIKALGIGDFVDFLATTNYFRAAKTSGLFPKVLQHIGISAGDIAYVGDNEQRDMEPAMAEGIFSIFFAESKNVSLNSFPPQVNTLRKLQYIFSDSAV